MIMVKRLKRGEEGWKGGKEWGESERGRGGMRGRGRGRGRGGGGEGGRGRGRGRWRGGYDWGGTAGQGGWCACK